MQAILLAHWVDGRDLIDGRDRIDQTDGIVNKVNPVTTVNPVPPLRGDYEILILDQNQLPWSVHSPEIKDRNPSFNPTPNNVNNVNNFNNLNSVN
jgi:hypothetical protein